MPPKRFDSSESSNCVERGVRSALTNGSIRVDDGTVVDWTLLERQGRRGRGRRVGQGRVAAAVAAEFVGRDGGRHGHAPAQRTALRRQRLRRPDRAARHGAVAVRHPRRVRRAARRPLPPGTPTSLPFPSDQHRFSSSIQLKDATCSFPLDIHFHRIHLST